VLRHTAQGRSIDETATVLQLEPIQVRQALLASMHQLGARTKLEVILHAAQLGLLDL
jgi:DNA-binding CsgD family transcriptional regulator